MDDPGTATVVGVVHLRLAIPAHTLKEKRAVVRSMGDRLRAKFNASIAEVGDLNEPSLAVLAAVCVANDPAYVSGQLQAVVRAAGGLRLDVELLEVDTELITL